MPKPDTSGVKPFGARVKVTDPPDDAQQEFRIHLPDGVRLDLTPGIVLEVGDRPDLERLDPGDVIWFSHVCNILGDIKIIEGGCIVAYEKLSDDNGEEALSA